jgi:hypothetical protein
MDSASIQADPPQYAHAMKLPMLLPVVAAATLLAGCGSDGPDTPEGTDASVSLLFMGNSHSSLNNLQGMVEAIVGSALPDETVEAVEAPGWMFLEDRVSHEPSMTLLGGQDWNFVVLQAQKYSTSGCCVYSTLEARQLILEARARNAVPILFPEWPLEGVNETMTIYDLHVSIAQAEPACVAPVGQAWDLSMQRHPGIHLYAADGNHSNAAGAFLTALILSATMTGVSPLDAPVLGGTTSAANQALLRVVAADTVAAWPPRQHCPDDPYPVP